MTKSCGFRTRDTVARGKGTLSISLGLLMAGMAAQSHAQSTPARDATAPGDQSASGLEEVVVTAQKRAERAEDVPISIASIDGDTLSQSGISGSAQLPQAVPALRIDYSGAFAQPTIRGVGSAAAGNGLSANVATYVDGFYVPSTQANDFQLLSVSNISVLKGPQGTLFGRNATGGAILVTTRDPSFDSTGTLTASYGRFNHKTISGYASTGLTSTLAVDVAGIYEEGDGFIRNIVTGAKAGKFDKSTVRSKLLWAPTDSTQFTLTYQHNDVDDPTILQNNLYQGLGLASLIPGAVAPSKRGQVANDNPGTGFTLKSDGVFLKGTTDVGFADLVSYTMYRAQKTVSTLDFDSSSIPIFHLAFFYKQDSFSQEFNLTSHSDGPFSWVVGANYFHDNDRQTDFLISLGGAPYVPGYTTSQKTDAVAGFFDGTYEVLDSLFLTLGYRYSSEKREAAYTTQSALVGIPGSDAAQHTWSDGTPRAVIRYEISPRTNVYASYTEGFKSGTYNPSGQSVRPRIEPEQIKAYEIGFKTASPLLRFNTSAFYYDYQDLQIASYKLSQSLLQNAASSEIYGVDADIVMTPMDSLELRLAGAYTHAEFDKFPGAPLYVQCLDPAACGAGFGQFSVVPISADGFAMPRSPRYTASAGVQYTIPVGSSDVRLNADYYRSSKVYFDPVQQFSQDDYGILNLRATYTSADEHLSVSLYGTNVTDTVYVNQVLPSLLAIGQTYGEPRAYGISATVKY